MTMTPVSHPVKLDKVAFDSFRNSQVNIYAMNAVSNALNNR